MRTWLVVSALRAVAAMVLDSTISSDLTEPLLSEEPVSPKDPTICTLCNDKLSEVECSNYQCQGREGMICGEIYHLDCFTNWKIEEAIRYAEIGGVRPPCPQCGSSQEWVVR